MFAVVVGAQAAVALPFLALSPRSIRGVPGPTLLLVTATGSFLLGSRSGVALGLVASVLAVAVLDTNWYITLPVWVAFAALAGYAGDRARAAEWARRRLGDELQSGLLPPAEALAERPELRAAVRYVPGQNRQLLGGDFFGVVELGDGTVAAMVGDISGHDATAAAMGAVLRAAWSGLALAGVDAIGTVQALDLVMREEQRRGGRGERFATLCTVQVDHAAGRLRFVLAGHHPPVLVSDADVELVSASPSPPLGVPWDGTRDVFELEMPAGEWSLLLYTDGLIEGHAAPGSRQRYGVERLCRLVAEHGRSVLGQDELDALLDDACEANGGPLSDDVVAFCLAPLPAGVGGLVGSSSRREKRVT